MVTAHGMGAQFMKQHLQQVVSANTCTTRTTQQRMGFFLAARLLKLTHFVLVHFDVLLVVGFHFFQHGSHVFDRSGGPTLNRQHVVHNQHLQYGTRAGSENVS